jgi:hypothetical protein
MADVTNRIEDPEWYQYGKGQHEMCYVIATVVFWYENHEPCVSRQKAVRARWKRQQISCYPIKQQYVTLNISTCSV